MISKPTSEKLIRLVVVFLAYFLTAKYGLSFEAVGGFAAIIWAPTGIAIAAMLLWGYEIYPAVALAALLINLLTGAPLISALGIMIGNTLEGLIGAYLLNRTNLRKTLDRVNDVLKLITFAALTATAISASLGVLSLFLGNKILLENIIATWTVWWIGDMLGVLIIVPFILIWRRRHHFNLESLINSETLILAIFLFVINVAVFTNILNGISSPLAYLLLLPIIWASTRFRLYGSTLSVIATAVIATWGTINNMGPFTGPVLSHNLLQLQLFMFSISITSLILASLTSELEATKEKYKELNGYLEDKVRERSNAFNEIQRVAHIGIWELNIKRNVMHYSEEVYRIFGIDPDDLEINIEILLNQIHADDRAKIENGLKKSLENKSGFEFKFKIIRPDKNEKMVFWAGEPILDDRDQILKMRGIIRDITELEKLKSQLVERTNQLELLNKYMVARETDMVEMKKKMESLRWNSDEK